MECDGCEGGGFFPGGNAVFGVSDSGAFSRVGVHFEAVLTSVRRSSGSDQCERVCVCVDAKVQPISNPITNPSAKCVCVCV